MNAGHIVVIDDEPELCELLSIRLEHHGYRVSVAGSAKGGLALLGGPPIDAMILDLKLGDASGLDVLVEVKKRAPDVPVIILTAHGTIDTAVQATRQGAWGFVTKPFHDRDLLEKLAHAVERSRLAREVAELRRVVGDAPDGRLLGTSPAIARVRELIARVAPSDATVLISGESGTGKELAARSLHALSSRRAGPFVAVNCGALPSELLESELFGHVRGAFTGAVRDKPGLFAAARGGTLFLDEIGESSLAVQVKLLRVLQERRFAPVGSTHEEEADVRVLAATNRDLRSLVGEGRFREDLFYRLHVVPLHVPPLRERPADVPLLAAVFLERAAKRSGLATPRLSREALAALRAYPWPGNVRELANAMEAALLMSRADEIDAGDLLLPSAHATAPPPEAEPAQGLPDPFPRGITPTPVPQPSAPTLTPTPTPFPRATTSAPASSLEERIAELMASLAGEPTLPQLREARDAFEKAYIAETLRRSGGNVAAAAKLAGRNRTDYYELLRRHGLTRGSFREP